MDLAELGYLLDYCRGILPLRVASPSGHDTKWNPNWTVRIEGEVRLSAGRQNG